VLIEDTTTKQGESFSFNFVTQSHRPFEKENMANNLTKQRAADACFGSCPVCGGSDGHINVGRSHWFRCDEHKVAWCIGSNLFSAWRDESQEEQRNLYERIGMSEYRIVEPLSEEENLPANRFDVEDIQSLPRLGPFADGEEEKIDLQFEMVEDGDWSEKMPGVVPNDAD
jgi:hypothetical protein